MRTFLIVFTVMLFASIVRAEDTDIYDAPAIISISTTDRVLMVDSSEPEGSRLSHITIPSLVTYLTSSGFLNSSSGKASLKTTIGIFTADSCTTVTGMATGDLCFEY